MALSVPNRNVKEQKRDYEFKMKWAREGGALKNKTRERRALKKHADLFRRHESFPSKVFTGGRRPWERRRKKLRTRPVSDKVKGEGMRISFRLHLAPNTPGTRQLEGHWEQGQAEVE